MLKRIYILFCVFLISLTGLSMPLIIQKHDGDAGGIGGMTYHQRERDHYRVQKSCWDDSIEQFRSYTVDGMRCPTGGTQRCTVRNANGVSCNDLMGGGR